MSAKLSAAETEGEGEQEREPPPPTPHTGQAAGLSHFLEGLEEVIAIGVCDTSRQHRGREQGDGRVPAAQNPILPMYP